MKELNNKKIEMYNLNKTIEEMKSKCEKEMITVFTKKINEMSEGRITTFEAKQIVSDIISNYKEIYSEPRY